MKIFNRIGSRNKLILIGASLSLVLFLWACYPDGGFSSLGDYDLIVTQYDPDKDFSTLDSMLDDGNLGTGKFQKTTNGRYTYMIESNGY